jgi:molybdopterin-guanine dinucleotide biosynthesis protein A
MTEVVGVILAGGQSSRLGGRDKALLPLAGRPLIEHAIANLGPQVDRLVISSNGDPAQFSRYALPVVPDLIPDRPGPLAGAHAALSRWPTTMIVTVAVDLPFIPADLVSRLRSALGDADCAYATTDRQSHALAILWRAGLAPALALALDAGARRVGDWLRAHGNAVLFPVMPDSDLDFNVNTPDDLALAEARLASASRGK